MTTDHLPDLSTESKDVDVGTTLEYYEKYIVSLAWKNVPRRLIHPDLLRDEVDELAQVIRVKFWIESQKRHIVSPKAYLSCIAYTEAMNMIRALKSILPLVTNQDGEIDQGRLLITQSAEMQDPAEVLEQAESLVERINRFVVKVLALPPREQQAFVWFLKRYITVKQNTDLLPLVDVLRERGLDSDLIEWSKNKEEVQRLRSLLSVVRRKWRN
ncbi:MAG TPA: hypothetical protein VKR06_42435 [Ktedonosporobacter sp.]|nr:hypothetical protein [Ktedonosporobacter sp.]